KDQRRPPMVAVQLLGHPRSRSPGVAGGMRRLSRTDGVAAAGPATVTWAYGAFRWAYGADWATRLHLVELPDCALTDPGAPGCQAHPLASRNSTTAGTVSATVDIPGPSPTGRQAPSAT